MSGSARPSAPAGGLLLGYGPRAFPLGPGDLEGRELSLLAPPDAGASSDAAATIRRALDAPTGPRLSELARGARAVAILVPGVDRVAAAGRYVPALLEDLRAAGVAPERITLHLATGTHRHGGPSDFRALVGDEVARTVRCAVHDPDDAGGLVEVGRTKRGTNVKLSRAVVEADVRVLTGRVIPHYFAGFGGGRKALLPGVAARSTILQNHKLTLAPERGLAPHVDAGSLEGNPVHLDMLEALAMVGPSFAVHMLLDTRHEVEGVVAGEPEASHAAACRRAEGLHRVVATEPFDALVTAAGGAPYDCSFVQALKAVFNLRDLVRPGGPVLWIAECPEGILPAFLEWAKVTDDVRFEREARSAYNLAAHNTVMLRAFLAERRVALVSALDPDAVTRLGIVPMPSLEAGLDWLRAQTAPGARIGAVPFANVTHGVVRGMMSTQKEGP